MSTTAQDLDFFDAHCCLGRAIVPARGGAPAPATVADLLAALDGYGIRRALVWHAAARDASVPSGNRLLAEQIPEGQGRLVGCWGFLPDAEPGSLAGEPLFKAMQTAGIRALHAWPAKNRFLLTRESCGRTLGGLQERAIPLLLSVSSAADWQTLYDLLRDFPRLTVIATDVGLWGVDRYARPLFEHYPNVRLETSEYQVAGGLQPLVETYGAGRLVFGSGFPIYHAGGAMLAIRHAPIPEAARRAIAGQTLAALLEAAQTG
jgi:hypothetical protein